MAACLRSRFLAMSRSSPPSSASTSLNAVAMARCSAAAWQAESESQQLLAVERVRHWLPLTAREHLLCSWLS